MMCVGVLSEVASQPSSQDGSFHDKPDLSTTRRTQRVINLPTLSPLLCSVSPGFEESRCVFRNLVKEKACMWQAGVQAEDRL